MAKPEEEKKEGDILETPEEKDMSDALKKMALELEGGAKPKDEPAGAEEGKAEPEDEGAEPKIEPLLKKRGLK